MFNRTRTHLRARIEKLGLSFSKDAQGFQLLTKEGDRHLSCAGLQLREAHLFLDGWMASQEARASAEQLLATSEDISSAILWLDACASDAEKIRGAMACLRKHQSERKAANEAFCRANTFSLDHDPRSSYVFEHDVDATAFLDDVRAEMGKLGVRFTQVDPNTISSSLEQESFDLLLDLYVGSWSTPIQLVERWQVLTQHAEMGRGTPSA